MKMDKRPTSKQSLRELANSEQVQDVCRKLAKDIRDDARRLAPIRTGNLRRHVVVEEITDLETGFEGFAVGWDDHGWYGWLVENGTERTSPRPHLVPAAIKNGVLRPGGQGGAV
jgi:HK97 gp10 family phage protein